MQILDGKLNVVVVAGASGIGREVAAAYKQQGCEVFVCDISDHLIESFRNDYPDILIEKADVSIYKDVADFFNKIKQSEESIDVLVNCAGIA